jgi:hypothetical protein
LPVLLVKAVGSKDFRHSDVLGVLKIDISGTVVKQVRRFVA